MGLVTPRHVGSSQTRARTHVPCIGRQILNHCATREAPKVGFELAQKIKEGILQTREMNVQNPKDKTHNSSSN